MPDERSKVESAVSNLKEVLKGEDPASIKKAIESLMTASLTIGKNMYEEAAKQAAAAGGGVGEGAGGAGGPGGMGGTGPGPHAGHGGSDEPGEPVGAGAKAGGKKDEDVIDAEFEVKE